MPLPRSIWVGLFHNWARRLALTRSKPVSAKYASLALVGSDRYISAWRRATRTADRRGKAKASIAEAFAALEHGRDLAFAESFIARARRCCCAPMRTSATRSKQTCAMRWRSADGKNRCHQLRAARDLAILWAERGERNRRRTCSRRSTVLSRRGSDPLDLVESERCSTNCGTDTRCTAMTRRRPPPPEFARRLAALVAPAN